jgi:hypothetical protein
MDIWQLGLMNLGQSFARLLLIIFSVSFTASLYLTHDHTLHLTIFFAYFNTAHPGPDDPADSESEGITLGTR